MTHVPVHTRARRHRGETPLARNVVRTALAASLAGTVAFPAVVRAQVRDATLKEVVDGIREGRRLRVATRDSVVVGRLVRVDDAAGTDSLVLDRAPAMRTAVHLAAIDTLWVMDDRFRRGALIGGVLGAVVIGYGLTLLNALAGAEAGSPGPGVGVVLGNAAAGFLAGGAIGGTMGSSFKRWTRISP